MEGPFFKNQFSFGLKIFIFPLAELNFPAAASEQPVSIQFRLNMQSLALMVSDIL